jgi:8-oxo-dGTP diphosphatase
VLLTYQAGIHHEFQLPGGGIDPGESPIHALHREVYEETGWRIAKPRFLGAFRRFAFMPEYDLWAEKICHIYHAFPVRKLGEPIEPDHSVHWVNPELAIDTLGNPGDRAFLQSLL